MPTHVDARPVSARGTTTITSVMRPDTAHHQLHYSVSRRLALGGAYHRQFDSDGTLHQSGLGTLGLLLWRKNAMGSQSNLFLEGGVGPDFSEDIEVGSHLFLGIDSESRRWFGMLAAEGHMAGDTVIEARGRVMLGVAPYLADYDEVAAWVMVHADVYAEGDREWDVTPHVRLMYRSIQVQAGASVDGRFFLSFVADI